MGDISTSIRKGQGCKSYVSLICRQLFCVLVIDNNPHKSKNAIETKNSKEPNYVVMLARYYSIVRLSVGRFSRGSSSFGELDALRSADVVVFVSGTSGARQLSLRNSKYKHISGIASPARTY